MYNSFIVNTLKGTIVYSDQFKLMLINRMIIQRVFVGWYKFTHPLKLSDMIYYSVILRFIIENRETSINVSYPQCGFVQSHGHGVLDFLFCQ